MQFASGDETCGDTLVALVERTFKASEGPAEGRLIGGLVQALLDGVPAEDLRVFTALDGDDPVGCILCTRLDYPEDGRTVFLLSPVAVAPEWQGQRVGQRLIRHGLDALRGEGVDVAITYGDPAFYGRVGFRGITEAEAAPPRPLGQPHGWLAQALEGGPMLPLRGPSRAVPPFDDPALW